MDPESERAGAKGVGFLIGMIAVFLSVVILKQTGYLAYARMVGLLGCIVLAISTGAHLFQMRHRLAQTGMNDDIDATLAAAVFLLVCVAPLLLAIQARPALVMLFPIAGLLAGKAIRGIGSVDRFQRR